MSLILLCFIYANLIYVFSLWTRTESVWTFSFILSTIYFIISSPKSAHKTLQLPTSLTLLFTNPKSTLLSVYSTPMHIALLSTRINPTVMENNILNLLIALSFIIILQQFFYLFYYSFYKF